MKKLVLAALLATGAGLVLPSCNNGEYHPEPANKSGGLNPLNPETGVKIYLGTMKANLNNTTTAFYPAFYTVPSENVFAIRGQRAEDNIAQHTISINIFNFVNLSEFNHEFRYSFIDKANKDSVVTYKGDMTVTLNGNENNNLRGWFYGSVHRIEPREDKNDIINITEGEFYVPKRD